MIVIPHFFGGIAILSFGTVLIVVAQTAEDFQLKIVTTSAPELGEGTTANWGQRGAQPLSRVMLATVRGQMRIGSYSGRLRDPCCASNSEGWAPA
jgi:hypothetical protein